jgi:hypothetical protein
MRSPRVLGAVLVLAAWGLAGGAHGTTKIRVAEPPLFDGEALAIAVSSSDAVIVATMIGDGQRWVDSSRTASCVVLSDLVVLKGDIEGDSLIVVTPIYGMDPATIKRRLARSQNRGVFFINKTRVGWLLIPTKVPEVLPLGEGANAEMVPQIRALAESQTLESISRAASVILVGRGRESWNWTRCTLPRRWSYCVDVVPEVLVAGSAPDFVVRVTSPSAPYFERAIFFLRAGPEGIYELVGSHAGVITIGPFGEIQEADVPALVGRITALRLGVAGPVR